MSKWYEKINPINVFKENAEVKQLRDKLDTIAGEMNDSYEVKFVDEEASHSYPGAADFANIDQMVDTAALQRVYMTETWVYSAVTAIAQDIASLPLKLQKKRILKKEVKNERTGEVEQVAEEVWEDASGEKLFKRFQYPNKFTTKTEFFMLLVIDLLTAGQYYVYLDADVDLTAIQSDPTDDNASTPFGRLRQVMSADTPIKAIYRIPPALVKPVMSEDRSCVAGYALQSDKGSYAFDAAEIVHVKLPNPLDPTSGLSPLIASFKQVLLDRFSTEHMIRFYKSGARLGGVIETEKSLNKEQLGRFQRSFENNFTGRQNHHRTLILPPGMKYNSIEQNPAETSLLEFCRYNREAVLAAFKVPPIKVGIMDNANYANARVQLQTYFTNSVKPTIAFIEDGFNLKSAMMPDSGIYRLKFDLSEVEELKEDLKLKADTGKSMIEAGLTVNEVRAELWKKPAIDGGDVSKPVEELKQRQQAFPIALSAPKGDVKVAESVPPTDSKPTTGTFTDRVNELVGQMVQAGTPLHLAIPKAIEQARLEGFVDEPEKSVSDEKLSTADQGALVPTAVGEGKPKKPCECEKEPCDCEKCAKCGKSPCECPPDSGKDGKQTLAEFLTESLSKLEADEPVTQDFLNELISIYNERNQPELVDAKESNIGDSQAAVEAESAATQDQIQSQQVYGFGYTKEKIVEHWKSFIEKTDPLVGKRHGEVNTFFKEFERIVLNRFGANIKSFGVFKARDNDDIEDILNAEAYEALIKQYIEEIDKALLEAFKQGYMDTLATFEFLPPNERALEFLKAYGAKEVKYITETTREQMREVLAKAFEENLSVGQVTERIRAKFEEIGQGRAATIARTETLSAVSAGQEQKRQDWQAQFPDQKLKKMWISAQDDRVRDSHVNLDGKSVDVNDAFENGLKYPREEGGAPEEVINCRCDTITFMEEDQTLIEETLPKEDEDEKSLKESESKGGPGSGCRGDNCGRPRGPYNRSAKGPNLGPQKISAADRNNGLLEERFNKTGAKVERGDAQAFTYTMIKPAVELQQDLNKVAEVFKAKGIDAHIDKVRVKDAGSLQKKMNEKWSDKTLNQVTDGVGGRIVFNDLYDMDKAMNVWKETSGLKIVEANDFTRDPQEGGYRAVHLLVKTSQGKIAEVQIKTQRGHEWSRWSHSNIYKNEKFPDLKKNAEVKAYTSKVSDLLYQMDLGHGRPSEFPEVPKALKDKGIPGFPWDKVK